MADKKKVLGVVRFTNIFSSHQSCQSIGPSSSHETPLDAPIDINIVCFLHFSLLAPVLVSPSYVANKQQQTPIFSFVCKVLKAAYEVLEPMKPTTQSPERSRSRYTGAQSRASQMLSVYIYTRYHDLSACTGVIKYLQDPDLASTLSKRDIQVTGKKDMGVSLCS